jgi:DNA-binding Xre family transcriptional regulator
MNLSSEKIVLDNLKKVLRVSKMDGLTLAKKVGWKSAKYYHKISGARKINLNDLDDFAKALRIKPGDLLNPNLNCKYEFQVYVD